MGLLVIGFHSHYTDCDIMCVTEMEYEEFSKYIEVLSLIKPLSSHSGKAHRPMVGIELSDRTLVVHSRHYLTFLSHHLQHHFAVYVYCHS